MKRLLCTISFLIITYMVSAQSVALQDSVRHNNNTNEADELQLNLEVIEQIDFGSVFMGAPTYSAEKSWLLPDETLPVALPGEVSLDMRQMLTLRPYKANTPYNWDPVKQKRISVKKDTWRNDPFRHFKTQFIYSNWAKTPFDKGIRSSLAEIEASGMRYNILAGRSGGATVGAWQKVGAPTGYDLMTPFSKDFWDKKGRLRRLRTLEVLSQYGDSTTVNVAAPVVKPAVR